MLLAVCMSCVPAFGDITLDLLAHWGGPVDAVYVDGTIAYLGLGHRLVLLDVTDPSDPQLLGESESLPDPVQAVTVSGTYAYVADFWGGGLVVFDVSDPANPVQVGMVTGIGPAEHVVVAGDYAYVPVAGTGLAVINVATPSAPFHETTYDTPGDARRVAVSGAFAYVADGPGGLQIVDITDPTAPVFGGSYPTSDEVQGVIVNDTTAYLAASGGGLIIVDVTDPGSPAFIGSCNTDAWAMEVRVAGDFAYVTNGWAGLALVDITTPSAPSYDGQYDTSGWASDLALVGPYAYVADGAAGLQIIDISAAPAASLAGAYEEASGQVIDLAAIPGWLFIANGGTGGGVLAMDVSNPVDPQVASTAPSYEFAWGMVYESPYAYLADGCAGLGVVDATDPTNLQRIGNAFTGCAARDVVVQGDFAYMADDHQSLVIVEVSDPYAPVPRGTWQDPINPGYALGLAVEGDYVFLANADAGLDIIDVSDPDNPERAANYDTPGAARDVAVADGYAYVADDWMGLLVLDVTDPENPTWVGECTACGSAQGVTLAGAIALVAANHQGVLVVDVSDPASPSIAAGYDTGGYARRVALADNLVFVADSTDGLVILMLGGQGDYHWINPFGGAFTEPTNWSPEGVPGPLDHAAFDLPDAYSVTMPVDADVTNDHLMVDGSDVALDLNGRTYTLARDTEASLTVGMNDLTSLYVQNGTLENRGTLLVADGPAADGYLAVGSLGGVESTLTSDYQMVVGINGGVGAVEVAGPESELHVYGRNPNDPGDLISLELGRGGLGVMYVLDGGYVHVPYGNGEIQTGYMTVGGGFGDGELTIDGYGSRVEVDSMLEVGRDGVGTIWVQNGGGLGVIGTPPEGGYSFIGMRAPGYVYVSGGDSFFTLAGQVSVGQAENGVLVASDGALVDMWGATFVVGDLDEPLTSGNAIITGADTSLFAGLPRIANAAYGYLEVSDGAYMESQRQMQLGYAGYGDMAITGGGHLHSHVGESPTGTSGIIGQQPGGFGHALVAGGNSQWTHEGALNVGWLGAGLLEIIEGGYVQSRDGVLARVSGSTGTATISDPDSSWFVTGTMSVGGLPTEAGGTATLTVANEALLLVEEGLTVWPGSTVALENGSISLGSEGLSLSGHLNGWGAVTGSVSSTGGTITPGVGGWTDRRRWRPRP